MLREALEQLQEMSQAAVSVDKFFSVIPYPGDPKSSLLLTLQPQLGTSDPGSLVDDDGNSVEPELVVGSYVLNQEVLPHEPPARNVTLLSVGDIQSYCEHAVQRYASTPSIWINGSKVIVLEQDSDDSWRDHRAAYTLPVTEEWKHLSQMLAQKYSIKALTRLLRVELQEAYSQSSLLSALKTLDWSDVSNTREERSRVKESMGRSVTRELTGEVEIPECIELTVRPFDDPALSQRTTIKCLITVHLAEQVIELTPNMKSMREALEVAHLQVRERLEASGFPVFYGSP